MHEVIKPNILKKLKSTKNPQPLQGSEDVFERPSAQENQRSN